MAMLRLDLADEYLSMRHVADAMTIVGFAHMSEVQLRDSVEPQSGTSPASPLLTAAAGPNTLGRPIDLC
jgi:hypothetical protein